MKILILGANGMLGHKLYQVLAPVLDVTGTIRGNYSDLDEYGFFTRSKIVPGINVFNIADLTEVIKNVNPVVVINCIGIIKQVDQAQDRLTSIWVNSLFPHQLHNICNERGIRLIHMSTDCVFSGKKGNYREDDIADAEDIYGKTKYLGEVSGDGVLTIRTSIIGRELVTSNGLVEWFLSNRGGQVNGFKNAIFSGFPTLHMARIIGDVIQKYPNLNGIVHISADPIDKFSLLSLIKHKIGLNIEINEHRDFYCNRSLDSTLFRSKTGFIPLSWEKMIDEFAEDSQQYLQRRA